MEAMAGKNIVYFLIQWEDRFLSVIRSNDVVEPKEEECHFREGQLITAKYGQQTYEAVICEIHVLSHVNDTQTLTDKFRDWCRVDILFALDGKGRKRQADKKLLEKRAALPQKYSYDVVEDETKDSSSSKRKSDTDDGLAELKEDIQRLKRKRGRLEERIAELQLRMEKLKKCKNW